MDSITSKDEKVWRSIWKYSFVIDLTKETKWRSNLKLLFIQLNLDSSFRLAEKWIWKKAFFCSIKSQKEFSLKNKQKSKLLMWEKRRKKIKMMWGLLFQCDQKRKSQLIFCGGVGVGVMSVGSATWRLYFLTSKMSHLGICNSLCSCLLIKD